MIPLPGAVPATGIDRGVAWHYGEPLRESRALADGEAFADLSHLGVVIVSGPDRLSWLHSLTTQDLAGLKPGQGAEALVLNPQGRIEHAIAVVDDGEASFLLTETPLGLVSFLDSMRFLLRVEVADATPLWAVFDDSATSSLLVPDRLSWLDPWPGVSPGGTAYQASGFDHPATGWRRRLTLVPRGEFEPVAHDLVRSGLRAAGTWATEARRVAAWRPRFLTEANGGVLPHELDWLRTAVHLKKGCYRGQEAVAKVHTTGRPPRRLASLHLDGSDNVTVLPGAEVRLDEVRVGHVTSSALHHEDGPIALALLKRTTDPEAPLLVVSEGETVAASQTPIVDPSGVSRDRPAPGPTARGLLRGRGLPPGNQGPGG